ncbi:ribosomal RNA small subunit methyltransferase A [Patescibacteria group bacterium]|nr:ribosomal RNA small subunit methyltransferase A [Patescibacteria group bacterium]MBU1934894.1 ribosomal RNA small subunit methyltransferase A [Patescibacteria group bacterium]
MSKLEQLKSLLQSKGLWAKKSLGQNFLVDEKALDTIVSAADLKKTDNVIEVGPGTGFLTERLIEKASHITSVELDKDMVDILERQFKFTDNLEILNQDILDFEIQNSKFKIQNFKVVANIPYYITSPLLKHFLQSDNRPSVMVVLVQKEVAEKICGMSGKSLITIETQLFGEPEIVDIVPSDSFYPAPKVDSAILKIKVFDKPLIPEDQIKDFLRLVKFGFSQKRKKLSNSLSAGLHMEPAEVREVLKSVGIDEGVRAEDLVIEDWKNLLTKLNK